MTISELIKKINNIKGLILSICGVLGLSFILHSWLANNFVTKEHFDNSIKGIETKLDTVITKKMDDQFVVLYKNINETQYNVLGTQLAGIIVKNKFELTPFELDGITKTVRKHCMLGMSLGYIPKDTNCEDRVNNKLNGGL